MARQESTPEQLEAIAAELIRAGDMLKATAVEMRNAGMPHMLLHSTMFLNSHLPATTEFAMKVQLDSVSQLRAFGSGTTSRIESREKYHANQKLAAAKKKSVKKKAT